MADVHRFNPNGLLVLLGSFMYAIAGGPVVVAGGFAIGVMLVLLNDPGRQRPDDEGPTSLFGTREPSSTHIRVVSVAPRPHMLFAFAPVRRLPGHRLR
jgi:hypothetical protein